MNIISRLKTVILTAVVAGVVAAMVFDNQHFWIYASNVILSSLAIAALMWPNTCTCRKVASAGLYTRYRIAYADGSPVDPRGEYFVLKVNSEDPRHAEASREALRAYSESIKGHNPILAKDLIDWVSEYDTLEAGDGEAC